MSSKPESEGSGSADNELVVDDSGAVERIESGHGFLLGQWYWLSSQKKNRRKEYPIEPLAGCQQLMCIVETGSNYVLLQAPRGHRGYDSIRVHHSDVFEMLTFEPNAQGIIQDNILHHRRRAAGLLKHIQKISAELGLPSQQALQHNVPSTGTAVAVLSKTTDVALYKKQLKKAEAKILPKLFGRLKTENEILSAWMSAEALELEAAMGSLEGTLGAVKDRVFNVSLYAGLTEHCTTVRAGTPAGYHEKIHLFQLMKYMDEEALVNYRAGGMEFKDIHQFDDWLAQEENFERILPFPKSVVLFQVRRNAKKRHANDLLGAFINLRLAQSDKYTYMFVRNGERLTRITLTDFEFSEKLFPDARHDEDAEPLMMKIWADSVSGLMGKREYDAIEEKRSSDNAKFKAWEAANPYEQWKQAQYEEALNGAREKAESPEEFELKKADIDACYEQDMSFRWRCANPYTYESADLGGNWELLSPESVYYDAGMALLKDETKQFNRMALILQGLLDRSDIFHPHPPAETWTKEGFDTAISLVFDGSRVLHDGDKPDIAAYIAKRNAMATAKSVFYGQEEAWLHSEADRERQRLERAGRFTEAERVLPLFKHWYNQGPGLLAVAEKLSPRSRKATFSWLREYASSGRWGEMRRATFTVSIDKLFNVSAYEPGDFKQFYNDPRTRQEYLEWAPMLLTAEDYHAGKEEVQMPAPKNDG